MAISVLERDLSDGIMLIQLLEILSNQVLYKTKRSRPHANPRMAQVCHPTHLCYKKWESILCLFLQLENVSFSLAFLENKGIKLGIDAAGVNLSIHLIFPSSQWFFRYCGWESEDGAGPCVGPDLPLSVDGMGR